MKNIKNIKNIKKIKKIPPPKKRISKSGMLTSASFGLLCACVIFIVCLAIFSAIGIATENPHSLLAPISFFSIYTSSFFGGFISAKKNKGSDTLLCGVVCGIFVFLAFSSIFFVLSLIFSVQSTPLSWLFRLLIILFSLVGSLVGKNKHVPKRRRR